MITRRLDNPASLKCQATSACPAIFTLEDGDVAIIGTLVTETLRSHLPQGSGCADHEQIIKIPMSKLKEALSNIE